jgi:hypothetical protein
MAYFLIVCLRPLAAVTRPFPFPVHALGMHFVGQFGTGAPAQRAGGLQHLHGP